jgi:hypothetical protein
MVASAHLHPGLQHGLSFRGFDDALKSGEPIWVVNNSQPKSMLIITITDPLSGKPKTMEFHRTFIPFCLTDMVPREILERSLELRNFVRKGVLKMVPEKEALIILNSDDGRQEHARLNTSEFALGGGISARVREMSDSSSLAKQTAGIASVAEGTDVQGLSSLHPQLKNWENRVLVGELDLASLQSELRIHASEFTETDCLYLINGQFPEEVRAWSKEKLKSGEALKAPAQATQQFASAASAKKYAYEQGDRGYESDYEIVK